MNEKETQRFMVLMKACQDAHNELKNFEELIITFRQQVIKPLMERKDKIYQEMIDLCQSH